MIPVKNSRLGLQNYMTSANEKYLSSRCVIMELIRAVVVEGGFSNANQLQELRKERRDVK